MSQLTQSQSQTQPVARQLPIPFAKYDDRISGLCDRILPKQPYVITIPSDLPYRRHKNDPNRWFLNTPFNRKEEQLQYMSLLLHQNDDEPLLKVDGTRIDEHGGLLAPAPASLSPQPDMPSRPDTPNETAPRKKISLKDYKKDRGGVNTPERKPVDDIRKQAIKSHKEEIDAKREEQMEQKKVKVEDHKLKTIVKLEQKPIPVPSRPTTPAVKQEPMSNVATPTQRDVESHRPVKKRRLSTEDQKPVPEKEPTPIAKQKPVEKRSLPALLSPDLPAAEKKQKEKHLPALLSPKLPQALETAATTPIHRSEESRAILKSALGSPARPGDKNGIAKDSPSARIRSESQTSARSFVPGIQVTSPAVRSTLLNRPDTPLATNGRTASPRPRQRHIIVLKYGKKNRRRVEMLLKFAPRQKKETAAPVEKSSPPTTRLAVEPAVKPDPPKPEKKRPAEPARELPAKKVKTSLEVPINVDRPSTPRPDLADKSPLSTSKHKSAFSTPKKDLRELKAPAMQRVASADTTIEARTPQEPARLSTPVPNQSSQPKTSPAPTSTPSKPDEHTCWTDLGTRIFQLGRTLKKEGSKLAAEGTGRDKQQGVVLLIEGLLCFMLNSAALAQARPHADPQWSTILPYFIMVYKQSRPYKHLHGLVAQLGAICRQHLQHEHIRRLSTITLPDEHVSAPTPGSDGTARTSTTDDSIKKQKSFIDLRDDLVANSKHLVSAWLEGSQLLAVDVIEAEYPSTWKKRMKLGDGTGTQRRPEKVSARSLPKEFPLPMDGTVSVFEATNFALNFLWEWTMIEGVKWKTRIEL